MHKPLPSLSYETIRQTQNENSTLIKVAVGVIHYQNQYLLGYRDNTQHQGDLYEFIGGKIDAKESALEALVREVKEETGIDIGQNRTVKLGELNHDYGDKKVCLQVYQIALNAEQYEQNRDRHYGLEGQALVWVDKLDLVAEHYPLPAANKSILAWLQHQQ